MGTYTPDNVLIVAAGNRESDRGVAYRMPSPLANRFVHLEMGVDFEDWQVWALENKIHSDVVGYLTSNKMDLFNFDPKTASRAFATPSWTFTSQLMPKKVKLSRIVNFMIWLLVLLVTVLLLSLWLTGLFLGSFNPTDILSGKVKTLSREGKEISAMFSLTASLCYELKEYAEKNKGSDKLYDMANNFFKFMMDNFETEMIVLGGRTALKVYKLPLSLERFMYRGVLQEIR